MDWLLSWEVDLFMAFRTTGIRNGESRPCVSRPMMFCAREILPLSGSEKPFAGEKQQAAWLLRRRRRERFPARRGAVANQSPQALSPRRPVPSELEPGRAWGLQQLRRLELSQRLRCCARQTLLPTLQCISPLDHWSRYRWANHLH